MNHHLDPKAIRRAFDQFHKRFRHLDRNDARIAFEAGIDAACRAPAPTSEPGARDAWVSTKEGLPLPESYARILYEGWKAQSGIELAFDAFVSKYGYFLSLDSIGALWGHYKGGPAIRAALATPASPAVPQKIADCYSDLLRIQRAEAETGDAYMIGLYNGMSMMCANIDGDMGWSPMTVPSPAPVAPSGCKWLPIETAPMDGTSIMLYSPARTYEGKPVPPRVTQGAFTEWEDTVSEYHQTTGEYLGQSVQDGGASWVSWDGGFLEELPPTHWMPLPPAPAASPLVDEAKQIVAGEVEAKPMMELTEDGWDFLDEIDPDWLMTLPRGTTLYLLPDRAAQGAAE
jgi:hypothetical protein